MASGRLKSAGIHAALRKRILAGDLVPGARLVTRELERQYNVSAIPVREALKLLEREGLVRNEPYVGASVANPSPREISEAFVVRAELEALAARLAVANSGSSVLKRMSEIQAEMKLAHEHDDGMAYGDLNREFHGALIEASNNEYLIRLIDTLWHTQTLYRRVFHEKPSRREESLREHEQLLSLIADGNPEKVGQYVLYHKSRMQSAMFPTMTSHLERIALQTINSDKS